MATTNLGKVSVTPKGAWSSSNAYEKLDIVTNGGNGYIALKDVPSGTAITNTSYWLKLVAKGDKGDTGATGATGATGNGIASVAKTSTSGLVDTYTITFTNGQTATFQVTNGEDGSVAPSAIASTYSSSATYAVGDYVWYEGDLYRCTTAITTAEAWTAGHWTEVALADEVSEVKNEISDNFGIYDDMHPDVVDGKCVIATDNSIATSDNYEMTVPIPVSAGQKITLKASGYNTVVGMIAVCNSDNTTRRTVAASIDSTERTYIYDVTEDGYIVCSYNKNHSHMLSISVDYTKIIGDVEMLSPQEAGTKDLQIIKEIDRHYITNNGENVASDNFFISQTIILYRGQTLNLTAQGYNQAVSMINLYDAENDKYTPLVISIDGTLRTYTYTATRTCAIRCSMKWYNASYSATITTTEDMLGTIVAIEDKIAVDPLSNIEYPQLFANIICMGDSLTKGYIGSGDTLATHNYPFYIRKLTNAEITNQSQGGITAQGFWETFADDYDYTPFDCAIIFLGTNGGLTNTVDTDCNADYTQNADTNTGCYGKIIGRIKATAPNCKIFVVAGVNDYIRRATTMNPAVRALAEFYEVGLADIENCIMSDSGAGGSEQRYLYRPNDGIHYNTFGYMTMANMIYDAMNKFMADNRTMFKSNN